MKSQSTKRTNASAKLNAAMAMIHERDAAKAQSDAVTREWALKLDHPRPPQWRSDRNE